MTGRDLAIYQAADAFELFTGLKPSIAEIGNAFDAVMAETLRGLKRLAITFNRREVIGEFRHCEPTGPAEVAGPMTGSAKQSSCPRKDLDCFVARLLAMTPVSPVY